MAVAEIYRWPDGSTAVRALDQETRRSLGISTRGGPVFVRIGRQMGVVSRLRMEEGAPRPLQGEMNDHELRYWTGFLLDMLYGGRPDHWPSSARDLFAVFVPDEVFSITVDAELAAKALQLGIESERGYQAEDFGKRVSSSREDFEEQWKMTLRKAQLLYSEGAKTRIEDDAADLNARLTATVQSAHPSLAILQQYSNDPYDFAVTIRLEDGELLNVKLLIPNEQTSKVDWESEYVPTSNKIILGDGSSIGEALTGLGFIIPESKKAEWLQANVLYGRSLLPDLTAYDLLGLRPLLFGLEPFAGWYKGIR